MFTEKGYSLSDVAAVTRNNEDGFFGGNGAWWILLFFMFAVGAEALATIVVAPKTCATQWLMASTSTI
jgi:hypothetical protein